MRVLHVIPSLSPNQGGPSVAIVEIVRALRDREIDAEIATTNDGGKMEVQDCSTLQQGVPVRYFQRRGGTAPLLNGYTWSPAFASWLKKNVRQYDVLHVHGLFSHLPTAAMYMARRASLPYINRPLGMLGQWPLRRSVLRKRAYLQLVETDNLNGAAALHFVSEIERSEAAALRLQAPPVVIPHGVVMPDFVGDAGARLRAKMGAPADRKLLLFLGRFDLKKGIDFLLSALACLPRPRPLLLLVGEGPFRRNLEHLIRRLQLGEDVRWLGFAEGTEKNLFLAGADLFVLTSHHENFGLAALEALAAGTPCLLSTEVALSSMIPLDHLGTVTPLSVGAIRDAMAVALQAPMITSERLARRAFIAANFSWAATAKALADLYREVLETSG